MLLKFNKNTELEILGIGTFIPGQFVVTDDEAKAKKYLDSGYFDLVKEKKKRKKSKKKGVDK
jgi:hypothetical protein